MKCEHFGRCGGCKYLDIPYLHELDEKKKILTDDLGSYGHLVKKIHEVRWSPCQDNFLENKV